MNATLITGLRTIADRFDHVLLDQWGALHEGKTVFPLARDCVRALRAAGKCVLVLSNSGKRADENTARLAALGLSAAEYDGMLTSGEVVWQGLRARAAPPYDALGRRALLIGRGDVRSLIAGLDVEVVADPAQADFLWLAGLDDARTDLDAWRAELARPCARGVPMLCANPDLTMFTARGLLPAAGALARVYTEMGGTVHCVGKPYPALFAAALHDLGDPPPERVLVIGDSLDHDIEGGRRAGMLTALVVGGVHAQALAEAPDLAAAVRTLAGEDVRVPHWVLSRLSW
jgi:HAD superfamily hydrolase (TIGR01459 family)